MSGDWRCSRRSALRSGLALGVAGALAGCGFFDGETNTPVGTVGTELVASGFAAPLTMAIAPGATDAFFVADQAGEVSVVNDDGRRSEPLLDVTDRMVRLSGYEERGLLGLAFHPDFARNRRVFVRYSAPLGDDMPSEFSHTFVLSEFRAPDGLTVDTSTERRVLEIPQPQSNHNAGPLAFGPDGFLYVTVGDGGGANDVGPGHASDWYERNNGGNGQDVTENLRGSVLRIDVDRRTGGRGYAIPADNPLVGSKGLDEHYAWGFRNPWGMSFDGDDLYVADVGQNRYEEVDLVRRGGNYGWNVREGDHCFAASAPSSFPSSCPDETPDGTPLSPPVIEYSHNGDPPTGVAVIGGYRYRGGSVESFQDRYVFGDWESEGTLFVADASTDSDGLWPVETVTMEANAGAKPGDFLLGFGRDSSDELYVLTTQRATPEGSTGRLHRLVPVA